MRYRRGGRTMGQRLPSCRSGERAGSGFTAIEILVIVAIVGVLAAIAVPWLSCSFERSRYSKTIDALEDARARIDGYESELGRYPPDLATMFADEPVPDGLVYCDGASTDSVCTSLGVDLDAVGYALRTSDELSQCAGVRIAFVTCCGAQPTLVPWGEELDAGSDPAPEP